MTLTRGGLRAGLQLEGFSYREARQIVTVIFDALTEAIKKSGTIELPFGTLTLRQPKQERKYRFGKIVRMGRKARVNFRRKD